MEEKVEQIVKVLNSRPDVFTKLKMLYRGKGNSAEEWLSSLGDKQIEGMYKLLKTEGHVQ